MQQSATKKLYIKTYGCQMNVYDSTRMGDVLAPLGYTPSDNPEGADLVILNTCHIREKAEEKVYGELGRMRLEKERRAKLGEKMMIAVAGCVAQAEGQEIMARAPFVDMVFGPQSYHKLPEMLTAAAERKKPIDLEFSSVQKFDFLPEETGAQGSAAFIAVQEGCDKFCTFCVVPYTRGAEYSRKPQDVEREARQLVEKGAREITLLGQNVNAYHGETADGETWSLAQLIRRLGKIDGLQRIRYTTSHPRDMREDLMLAHAEEQKLMPYLHLPVQSGSDRILKAMNRRHTAADYIAIIERLRAMRPDMAFSGDFIVGFPGETEADFQATLGVVRHVGYASAYSFKYSPRPGTPASDMEQVPEDVKNERLQRLQSLISEQAAAFNRACIGREMDVLLERDGKYEGQLVGRSPYMHAVHVRNSAHLRGQIVKVRITEAFANSLAGEINPDTINPATSLSLPLNIHLTEKFNGKPNGNGSHNGVDEISTNLTFADNRLLPMLYGEHDANLARIEKRFHVSAASRGNQLAITGGDPAAVEASRSVLSYLYAQLEQGGEIGSAQVDAAIRMAAHEMESGQETIPGLENLVIKTMKKHVRPYSPGQAAYIQALHDHDMVFALGPAGTGKTYIAVAMAVAMFMHKRVERIILSRPAVEAGEKLGFLPGDLKEKIDPYLRPLYDALFDMIPGEKVQALIEAGAIEVAPLAFMRGRTLANSFVILDESQNTTATQMKMFLTRLGENSRMVVTGDLSQIDLPRDVKSGLSDATRKLEGIEGISISRFTDSDVVRHPLAARIVQAYEEWDRKKKTPAA